MNLALLHSAQLPSGVREELEAIMSTINAVWDVGHNPDGTHKDVPVANAPAPVPTGGVIMFGGGTAPSGWLFCTGAAVSRTQYSNLFGVIGAAYGAGDGSTTFNLPNFTLRIPIGANSSGAMSVLGATAGAYDHTHTGPSHQHDGPLHQHSVPSHTHTGPSHTHTGPSHQHSISSDGTGSTGAGSLHNHSISTVVIAEGTGTTYTVGNALSTGYESIHTHAGPSHDHFGLTGAGGTGATGAEGTGATGGSISDLTGWSGSGVTGLGGTGATGAANPPVLVINFIIKT